MPLPRQHNIVIDRPGLTLAALMSGALTVTLTDGRSIPLIARIVGAPFAAKPGSGWMAVKVRSEFGPVSTLLLEGGEDDPAKGAVTGVLKVRY